MENILKMFMHSIFIKNKLKKLFLNYFSYLSSITYSSCISYGNGIFN